MKRKTIKMKLNVVESQQWGVNDIIDRIVVESGIPVAVLRMDHKMQLIRDYQRRWRVATFPSLMKVLQVMGATEIDITVTINTEFREQKKPGRKPILSRAEKP